MVLFLLAGRLVIWFIQNTGLLQPVRRRYDLVNELIGCDLCLGFWVYLVLAVLWDHSQDT